MVDFLLMVVGVPLIYIDSQLIYIDFSDILYFVLMVREDGHKWGIWAVRRWEAKIIDFDSF